MSRRHIRATVASTLPTAPVLAPVRFVLSRTSFLSLSVALSLLLAACGGGGGGSTTTPPVVTPPVTSDGSLADPVAYSGNPGASLASAVERAAIVKASLTLNATAIPYTATTGHLTGTDTRTGRAASYFYVAYTADNKEAGKRPVTFFYNGGPGSASMWLHMGSFAPKRIPTQIPSNVILGSGATVDNAESLLDVSDLVFVDAIGTGYSQAIAPAANQDFWGVDADAAGLRDFVRRYVEVNARQASPKVLLGESYGSPRTAVLANLLETAGVHVDGVVLHSAIMDYNSNCGVLDVSTVSCEGYLPTYAATSAYYKLTNPVPTDQNAFLQEVRTFSAGGYRQALSAYLSSAHTPAPQSTITQLVNVTGLSAIRWQQDLNLKPGTYAGGLLPGQLTGRYDARVAGPNTGPLAADGDPSLTVVNNAFVSGMRSHLAATLKYSAITSYTSFIDIIERWNFRHDGKELPDTIPDLASAMTLNPSMKVLAQSGYHDLATPYYQTELDLARLGKNPNIQIRNYASGHMIYLDDAARRAQKADLATFYSSIMAGK